MGGITSGGENETESTGTDIGYGKNGGPIS